MVEYFMTHQQFLEPGYKVALVPVIFTTANLWTSEVDLGAADLETGSVAVDAASLKPVPWLWLNYNQSPGLKHSLVGEQHQAMDDMIEAGYTRSIAIVNALGVADFLRWQL